MTTVIDYWATKWYFTRECQSSSWWRDLHGIPVSDDSRWLAILGSPYHFRTAATPENLLAVTWEPDGLLKIRMYTFPNWTWAQPRPLFGHEGRESPESFAGFCRKLGLVCFPFHVMPWYDPRTQSRGYLMAIGPCGSTVQQGSWPCPQPVRPSVDPQPLKQLLMSTRKDVVSDFASSTSLGNSGKYVFFYEGVRSGRANSSPLSKNLVL
jgi:hypothetical protein